MFIKFVFYAGAWSFRSAELTRRLSGMSMINYGVPKSFTNQNIEKWIAIDVSYEGENIFLDAF